MSSLKLIPFNKSNTELVLKWRNSKRIRSNMLDDSIISFEKHNNFIGLLTTDTTKSYFVIELNDRPVGTIYFNGIGSDHIIWGCYIGVEKVIPGFFVLLIVIAIKFAFSHETTLSLYSEVAVHNPNPIKANNFLGISIINRNTKFTANNNEVDFLEYEVKRESSDLVLEKALKILPSSMKILIENLNIGK